MRWACAVPALAGILVGAGIVGAVLRRLSVATALPALPSQIVVLLPVEAKGREEPSAPVRERRPVPRRPPAEPKQEAVPKQEVAPKPKEASEPASVWAGSCKTWAICGDGE